MRRHTSDLITLDFFASIDAKPSRVAALAKNHIRIKDGLEPDFDIGTVAEKR